MKDTVTGDGYKIMPSGVMLISKDYQCSGARDNIQVPQVDTTYGAGFGDAVTDGDRAFSACREPIAHFLTYIVAADMTDKWFTVDDPDTEEADPALDRTIQDILNKLKAKTNLLKAVTQARIYGRALLVGAFNDAKNIAALAEPVSSGAELMQLAVYPDTYQQTKVKEFQVASVDVNPVSPRYGKPVTYRLYRQNLNESGQSVSDWLMIHWTRVCEVGDGTSVLDKIWDDMGCGRNIRWGAAQWMYRVGSGFPVISFPEGTTAAELEAYHNGGAFNNIMSRTGIFIAQNSTTANTGMTFEFKGPAGQSLDPAPFYVQNIQQIAIATGYPQAKLIGAQAGAVTGSEVNQQEYYKAISRDQQAYCEEPIRWIIDHLAVSGQIGMIRAAVDKTAPDYRLRLLKQTVKRLVHRDYRHKTTENYVITWNSAFELNEKDEVLIEASHTQANVNKLKYMTKDEVRAEEGLDPLPNGEGATIVPEGLQLFNQKGIPNSAENPQATQDPMQAQLQNSDMYITFAPKPPVKAHKHESAAAS